MSIITNHLLLASTTETNTVISRKTLTNSLPSLRRASARSVQVFSIQNVANWIIDTISLRPIGLHWSQTICVAFHNYWVNLERALQLWQFILITLNLKMASWPHRNVVQFYRWFLHACEDRNSWFATTWQGGHVGGQYKRNFSAKFASK